MARFLTAEIVESANFEKFADGRPLTLGIDEAGRGPVLGPMVYACALVETKDVEHLKALGICDSKTLNEAKRSKVFEAMEENEELVAYAYRSLPARYISGHMLSLEDPQSLNELSHQSAIGLIRNALKRGANVQEVFVDTVGPKATYQEMLEREFPGVRVTVSEKADALFPIVGAASIVAKVKRDAFLDAHEFDEAELRKPKGGFGSGYPGDPATQKYLCQNIDPVFGFSSLIRFSWKTTEEALSRGAVKCEWSDPNPPQTLFAFFQKTNAVPVVEKAAFFKDRKIKHAVEF
ncbi:Ribonuclease [Aphelenchoides fujianensis]|nr:Ribonuclease [Aphelenchoides fujianensis]